MASIQMMAQERKVLMLFSIDGLFPIMCSAPSSKAEYFDNLIFINNLQKFIELKILTWCQLQTAIWKENSLEAILTLFDTRIKTVKGEMPILCISGR